MAIIEIRDLTYSYPITDKPALRNITLEVEEGQFLAVIGPNGAGKSTLCYTIAGFVPHFFKGRLEGQVQVGGIDTQHAHLNDFVQKVGLVFQNPFNQISGSKFTVYEEIAFGLENRGVPRDEMMERINRIMEMTGIQDLGDRSPYALSGGQQQRVALASILVLQPSILVLDEPTSQLDPIGTREVFQVIKDMSQQGMTIIMAEHKIEWVAEFADRIVALSDGELLMLGSPQEVLTSSLLPEHGIGSSRYTAVARQAVNEHLWPSERPLPVKLNEAIEGFQEILP
jgi:energy-coupling factor transporter ATP-binding protein EcfA2